MVPLSMGCHDLPLRPSEEDGGWDRLSIWIEDQIQDGIIFFHEDCKHC